MTTDTELRESEGWASYAAECERHAETTRRAEAAEAKLAAIAKLVNLWDDSRARNGRPMLTTANVVDRLRVLLDTPAPTPGHSTCGQPGCSDGGA